MWFTHEFEGPIERHGVGRDRKVWYTVVFLPEALTSGLPFDRHPQLRVEGEIADVPVKGAFLSSGDGRYYLIVSPETLKAGSIAPGQTVAVRFRIADQDAVDVPPALEQALRGDTAATEAWEALTTGRRRALAHHVATAKGEATRARRAEAVLVAITGRTPSDRVAGDVERLRWLFRKR